MELLAIANELLPGGEPQYLSMVEYPKISDLINEQGRKEILKIVFLIVKDFCNSFNVVRNMNEDQMIEAANMLIEDAGNYRLEDYYMMFAMAKKGQLVKIYDRIDVQVINEMADNYNNNRQQAAWKVEDEKNSQYKSLGFVQRESENHDPLSDSFSSFGSALSSLKIAYKEKFVDPSEELKEIIKKNTEA